MSFIQTNDTYSITNAQGGTCMDVSGADETSIIGYGFHNGPNQEWLFENAGGDKTFNLKSKGSGKYLSPAGDLNDGQKVVAGGSSYAWRVEDESGVDGGVRVSPANNLGFCIDLANHGDSTPGTPVQLWGRWGGPNQVWKLQKV